MLTHERLKEVIYYDQESGIFRWKVSLRNGRGINRRTSAGSVSRGYILIGIDGKRYKAHRLAWFFVYGEWPIGQIDHKNGNKSDNRIHNLRVCSQSQNNINSINRVDNTSGYRGVSFFKKTGKFQAHICVNKRQIHLGYFSSAEDASEVYRSAALEYFGEFAETQKHGITKQRAKVG